MIRVVTINVNKMNEKIIQIVPMIVIVVMGFVIMVNGDHVLKTVFVMMIILVIHNNEKIKRDAELMNVVVIIIRFVKMIDEKLFIIVLIVHQ
jgi:hypothetical protein